MYVVFVAFYLVGRTVLIRRKLTDRRRIALAATAAVDQSLGQLDARHLALALGPSTVCASPPPGRTRCG
jgi:hypothetical protein